MCLFCFVLLFFFDYLRGFFIFFFMSLTYEILQEFIEHYFNHFRVLCNRRFRQIESGKDRNRKTNRQIETYRDIKRNSLYFRFHGFKNKEEWPQWSTQIVRSIQFAMTFYPRLPSLNKNIQLLFILKDNPNRPRSVVI